jgi:hypothetical protein
LQLGLDVRGVDTTAARVGYSLATGLDDRGVMYLRFGSPEHLVYGGDNPLDPRCSTTEVERWRYREWGEVRFARPAGLSTGQRNVSEEVFRPMNERQFQVMQLGLTRDVSSEPAPLVFGLWLAQFQDEHDPMRTDLVVVSTRGQLAAALVGAVGGAAEVRQSASGHLTLAARPREYLLTADTRIEDTLGRQSLGIRLRHFDSLPAVSDLLLARRWIGDSADRSAMLEHVQRDLTFDPGDVVRAYMEVYGMQREGDVVNYRATYRMLRTDDPGRDLAKPDWPGATVIQFDRVRRVASGAPVPEVLDITPQGISKGKYLVRVEIWDKLAGREIGRATIALQAR